MDEWIELTEDTIEEALGLAGASAYNKNNLKRTLAWHRCDSWIWDLQLRVGHRNRCLLLVMRMEEGWANGDGDGNGVWHLDSWPHGWEQGTIHGLTRPKDDDEAMGLFQAHGTGLLQTVVTHGLYERSDGDRGRDWRIRKSRSRREGIFFQSTEPRGNGLDDEDLPPERRWRVLQTSDGWKRRKAELDRQVEEMRRGTAERRAKLSSQIRP